jgi:hypothetical protein
MPEDLSSLNQPHFTDPLAKLEGLLSQSRRAFLLGAGCSKCAGLPLTAELTDLVLGRASVTPKTTAILSVLRKNFGTASNANIEDYMSELVDLISIAERRRERLSANFYSVLGSTDYSLDDLQDTLGELKFSIADSIGQPPLPVSIETHRKFARTIHNTLKAGRSDPISPVDYIVLNYDTLIEDSLALEQVTYTDGFQGGVTGWWAPSSFAANVSARVFKVHGSIDWCRLDDSMLPRRIRPSLQGTNPLEKVLIWPAATKYRETQRDPYAQIITLIRQTLRPISGSEIVLTVCGYAFGDTHINVEIDRALHESDQRLTVVAFTSSNEPAGQLKKWLEDPVIQDQVRVYANRGFFHGKYFRTSDFDLPWWKFEVLARILRGER